MALRIIGNISETERPAVDAQSITAALAAGARSALAVEDLDGYRACFRDAAAIDDPQRRYQAEIALIEQGLRYAHQAGEGPATRAYAAVADEALTVLEREPCEPIVLSYAGVACYELWALDGARALFGAAMRLDPALPDVARNLSELDRRARGRRLTRPLHGSVPGLVRRAVAVARGARAARGLTLSLCMIVRNEERMLGRCLQAAKDAVDEIVVVDTGSTDSTIEIARSFGARVIERPWTGSFADARNTSFQAATGDWLLYLDADEVLVTEDAARLRELTGHTWREAFHLIETSFVGELGEGTAVVNTALRMFRNRPEYRFEGRIHEQIAHTLPTYAPGRIEHTSVRIEHYGYLGDTRLAKDKSTRNLALLREQLDSTATPTPFLHFNIGCEYAAAGRAPEAVTELTRAWELLTEAGATKHTEYAPSLLATLVRVLRLAGRHADALRWAHTGLDEFADFTDLVLEQAAATFDAGRETEAVALCERCLTLGDAPARYGGMVGTGTYLPRLVLARLALAHDDPQTAVELLDWCVDNHPEYLGVAGPYAVARLRAGAQADDVVDALQTRLRPLTHAARTALAHALVRAGAPDAACEQFRQILSDPGDRSTGSVRAAFAELLLGRGEWVQAADQAAQIPDDDPFAALACRIETAARIAARDISGARGARARATRVGLGEAESDALDAWIDAAAGAPSRGPLAVAGVPLLATMLAVMLAAGERAQYGLLRALVESSRLDGRECVELIAETHLRHGDLATAAAQWLAVCARAPDARARIGLAQVAAATGSHEDAVLFAQAALELEPGNTVARALLDRLHTPATRVPALAGDPLDG